MQKSTIEPLIEEDAMNGEYGAQGPEDGKHTKNNEERSVLSEVLGSGVTQTGMLVALVVTTAQPFGMDWFKGAIIAVFGVETIAQYSLLTAALFISLLVAVWQVRYVQNVCGGRCLLLTFLVWLVLFSMTVGGNNSIKQALVSPSKSVAVKTAEQKRSDETNELRQDLNNALDQVKMLQSLLPMRTSDASWFSFVTPAYAQSDEVNEDETITYSKEEMGQLSLQLKQLQLDLEQIKEKLPAESQMIRGELYVRGDGIPNKVMF